MNDFLKDVDLKVENPSLEGYDFFSDGEDLSKVFYQYGELRGEIVMYGSSLGNDPILSTESKVGIIAKDTVKKFTASMLDFLQRLISIIKNFIRSLGLRMKSDLLKYQVIFYEEHKTDEEKIKNYDLLTFNTMIPQLSIDELVKIIPQCLDIFEFVNKTFDKNRNRKATSMKFSNWSETLVILSRMFSRHSLFREYPIFDRESRGNLSLPDPKKVIQNKLFGKKNEIYHVNSKEFFERSKWDLECLSSIEEQRVKNTVDYGKKMLKKEEKVSKVLKKELNELENLDIYSEDDSYGISVVKIMIRNEIMLYNFFIGLYMNVLNEYFHGRSIVYKIARDTSIALKQDDETS